MEDIPLTKRLEQLEAQLNKTQTRKFRIPRRGKLTKRQQRRGYAIIQRIDDNGNVDFEKKRLDGETYRLSTGSYHTSDEKSILSYKGKPFIIQPTKKLNPYNPLRGENETYGQDYVMARMLGDTIKVKGKGGAQIVWIIGIAIAAYLGYSMLTGGL